MSNFLLLFPYGKSRPPSPRGGKRKCFLIETKGGRGPAGAASVVDELVLVAPGVELADLRTHDFRRVLRSFLPHGVEMDL